MVLFQMAFVVSFLIDDFIAAMSGLRFDRHGHNVATSEFFDKALAFFVYDNAVSVEARVVEIQKRARKRIAYRVGLNILHIDESRSDFFGHDDTVACTADRIRRKDVFIDGGIVFFAHKTLQNALSGYKGIDKEEMGNLLVKAGIDSSRRAETLGIEEFANLQI